MARQIKRSIKRRYDKVESKILESVLTRIDGEHSIHINKNEFKIGTAKYNDEIISEIGISRKHCIFRCEDNKWKLEDLSTSVTLINNVAVPSGIMQDVCPGDIIQFSPNVKFKYLFNFVQGDNVKKQTATKNNKEELLRTLAKLLEDKLQEDNATRQTIKELDMKIQQIEIFTEMVILKTSLHMKEEEEMRKKLDNIMELRKNISTIENIHQYINTHQFINNIDSELTCSICSELFLKATILNCSHTFCQYCINNWNKVQMNCPLCRESITAKVGQPILDNFIEKMIENFKLDLKDTRKYLIEEREAKRFSRT